MATCTSCPHNLTDDGGNLLPHLANRAYETMPCATCDLIHSESVIFDADKRNHGEIAVSLDALANEGEGDFEEVIDPCSVPGYVPKEASEEQYDKADAMLDWAETLEPRDREILLGLENKATYEDIAATVGMTKQGVWLRAGKIRAKFVAAFRDDEVGEEWVSGTEVHQ